MKSTRIRPVVQSEPRKKKKDPSKKFKPATGWKIQGGVTPTESPTAWKNGSKNPPKAVAFSIMSKPRLRVSCFQLFFSSRGWLYEPKQTSNIGFFFSLMHQETKKQQHLGWIYLDFGVFSEFKILFYSSALILIYLGCSFFGQFI